MHMNNHSVLKGGAGGTDAQELEVQLGVGFRGSKRNQK